MDASISKRIQNSKLTRSGRLIAQYILDNKSKVVFSAAGTIARELGVSDISITRLCRTLGYGGYQEMRTALQEEISERIEQDDQVLSPLDKLVEGNKVADESVIEQIASLAVSGINQLLLKNSEEKFDQIARRIYHSRNKVLVGARGAVGVIEFLYMSMSFLLPGLRKVTSNNPNEMNPVLDLTEADCLFVYSCSRYPAVTRYALDIAKKNKAFIILMTDMETSPLASDADIVITVAARGVSHFSSPTVATVAAEIINTKIARLAYLDENHASRFQHMEDFTKATNFYLMSGPRG